MTDTHIRKVVWAYAAGGFDAELIVTQGERARTWRLGSHSTESEARFAADVAADNLILTLIGAGVKDVLLQQQATFHDLRVK